MFSKWIAHIAVAFQTFRSNPLHTLLSTLGIVIGVAALVAILSLIDGLEQFGRQQLERTTDLQGIQVMSKTDDRENGVVIKRDEYPLLDEAFLDLLVHHLGDQATVTMYQEKSNWISWPQDTTRHAALVYQLAGTIPALDTGLIAGKLALPDEKQVVVNNKLLMYFPETRRDDLIGKKIFLGSDTCVIGGIVRYARARGGLLVFRKLLPSMDRHDFPPQILIHVNTIENVAVIQKQVEALIREHYPDNSGDFVVLNNTFRVDQATQGILLFKLIMAFITGISVLVGGIGIMNVLLMSITERTREIGIRKALGARKRDISNQFLAEAVGLSLIGSLLGMILGMLMVQIALPLIKKVIKAPFGIVYNPSTLLIIFILALLIGIIFGTYPALRAARLTPVDAIRHE